DVYKRQPHARKAKLAQTVEKRPFLRAVFFVFLQSAHMVARFFGSFGLEKAGKPCYTIYVF
ncbi:MAG: hypothetical protein Q3Y08_08175, partial [Butyricicoccus sp.]|nr:hypothetical protein [Butyricicoccus sp.]